MVYSGPEIALDRPDRPVTHRYDEFGKSYISSDTTHVSTNIYEYGDADTLIEELVSVVSSTPLLHYSITPTPPLYCGEQFDPDLGLYFLRARYMDPERGRFWSMDTFEGNNDDPASLHKYLYCSNDPVGLIDPLGLGGYGVRPCLML